MFIEVLQDILDHFHAMPLVDYEFGD